MRLPAINLSPRAKRIAKWVGYPLLAIVSFLFALQQTLPTGAIKRRVSDLLAPTVEELDAILLAEAETAGANTKAGGS